MFSHELAEMSSIGGRRFSYYVKPVHKHCFMIGILMAWIPTPGISEIDTSDRFKKRGLAPRLGCRSVPGDCLLVVLARPWGKHAHRDRVAAFRVRKLLVRNSQGNACRLGVDHLNICWEDRKWADIIDLRMCRLRICSPLLYGHRLLGT